MRMPIKRSALAMTHASRPFPGSFRPRSGTICFAKFPSPADPNARSGRQHVADAAGVVALPDGATCPSAASSAAIVRRLRVNSGLQEPRRRVWGVLATARIVSAILSLPVGLRTLKYARTNTMVSCAHIGSLALRRGPWKKNDGGTSSALANSNRQLAGTPGQPLSYLWIC